ncbi:hypothetical protein MCEMSEM23_01970 [Rhabdaerophilaceae bacterium]
MPLCGAIGKLCDSIEPVRVRLRHNIGLGKRPVPAIFRPRKVAPMAGSNDEIGHNRLDWL